MKNKTKKIIPLVLGSALLISGFSTLDYQKSVATKDAQPTPTVVHDNLDVAYAAGKAKSNYDDLYDGDWQLEYADWAVKNGTIKVYDDNTIRVSDDVTESMLMSIIGNYIGVTKASDNPSEDKLYKELQKLGIVSAGTYDKKSRKKIVTVDAGLTLIMTLFDSDDFKNRKDKLNVLLNEVNADKNAKKLAFSGNLMKVDVLRILKANETLGSELVLSKPTSTISKAESNLVDLYYADDRAKSLAYFEKSSGLLITLTNNTQGMLEDSRIQPYVEYLTDKVFTGDEEDMNANRFILTLRAVRNHAIEINNLDVALKVGSKTTHKKPAHKQLTLNGESKQTFIVNSANLSDLEVTVNGTKFDFDFSKFQKIPNNSLYLKSGDALERKPLYVTNDLRDMDYQIVDALFSEYGE